jgi:hypothetical protein
MVDYVAGGSRQGLAGSCSSDNPTAIPQPHPGVSEATGGTAYWPHSAPLARACTTTPVLPQQHQQYGLPSVIPTWCIRVAVCSCLSRSVVARVAAPFTGLGFAFARAAPFRCHTSNNNSTALLAVCSCMSVLLLVCGGCGMSVSRSAVLSGSVLLHQTAAIKRQ